ncbi:MAG TPA: F0F1 ATP synthase subunit gamma [Sandaracinaceae bacterium LLY-WYZ-13_1]|nr:F0F1 ATP synthase subunit gamma [Sandaracinaceae bacterium LLY-WYZ-13_1]
MANLKAIRKRIGSVKSTQKITRAMKMVAAARLSRAQMAITELRPYALKTLDVLSSVATRAGEEDVHPLLARRPAEKVMLVVLTSDRGLAGAFNANVCKAAYQRWKKLEDEGAEVSFAVIGRKGRDYFRRRGADIRRDFTGVFEDLSVERAGEIGRYIVGEYTRGGLARLAAEEQEGRKIFPGPSIDPEELEGSPHALRESDEGAETFVPESGFADVEPQLDAVFLVYNEFKSAISQDVVVEPLLPIDPQDVVEEDTAVDFIYEPTKRALLDRLLPMYVEIEVYRALLESVASEHGARMTAMDAATKNANEMIDRLTLEYNRARQAAITTELMEIIGGAEALKG